MFMKTDVQNLNRTYQEMHERAMECPTALIAEAWYPQKYKQHEHEQQSHRL